MNHPADNAQALTFAQLAMIWDELRRVVYVNPEDALHPSILKLAADTGIDIEHRPHMPKGTAFLRETDVVAVIDLSNGEAFVSKRQRHHAMDEFLKP